jgi:O-acetyl-ADP-ribose deacetylase (regulator of RNase III)
VHALGGKDLIHELEKIPCQGSSAVKCEIGSAVSTPSAGELVGTFHHIIHTATPSYQCKDRHGDWTKLLASCYKSSFDLACEITRKAPTKMAPTTIAAPLLGAGAKLGPASEAAGVAVTAASSWVGAGAGQTLVLQLACMDPATAALLQAAIEEEVGIWEVAID